jgi:hypothetical protein
MGQGVLEEPEAVGASALGLGAVGVTREAVTMAMFAFTAWPIGTHSRLNVS